MEEPLVHGDIHFAQQPRLPANAKAHVRLLETGTADAPARVVAEQVMTDIWQKANAGQAIPFTLSGAPPNERGSYTVSVLIDLDGDGRISLGDFINKQSYPVLTYGYPNQVSIQVKEVS